jgi:predicted Zn-dependent peptidase
MEKKTVLPNGVRIVTEEIPHVHSVAIGLWVDTGSKNEHKDVWGISHFIEHMLFKGTKTRTAMQIAQELEDTGGSINAFTDKENTCFYARVLDTHIDKAIDVLTDIYLNSVFDPEEIEREKQVVLEELKMYEDSPDELSYDTLVENVWHGHPLGHKIIGLNETIQGFSREKILNYMADNYTTDRLVIAIAGKINTEQVIEKLQARLGHLNGKKSVDTEPSILYNTELCARYKDIEQLHVCLGTKGPAVTDEERYTFAVIDSILGGGMSSRLFQELREKRGLAYSIGSYELMYKRGGIFGVYAGISPDNLKDTLKYTLQEFDHIREGRVSEEDISRAKEHLKGSMLLSLEAVKNRMMRLSRNEIYFHRSISSQEIIDSIDKVDFKQITEVASGIFDPKQMSLVVVGPLKELSFSLTALN